MYFLCNALPAIEGQSPVMHAADRVRVIGLGSPYGADTMGWCVARALRTRLDVDTIGGRKRIGGYELTVETADRPGPALLSKFDGVRWAILIDAFLSDGIGSPRWVRRDELDASPASCSSHTLGVSETLALGEVLGSLPPRLSILAIGVDPASDPDAHAAQWTHTVDEAVQMLLASLLSAVGDGHLQTLVST